MRTGKVTFLRNFESWAVKQVSYKKKSVSDGYWVIFVFDLTYGLTFYEIIKCGVIQKGHRRKGEGGQKWWLMVTLGEGLCTNVLPFCKFSALYTQKHKEHPTISPNKILTLDPPLTIIKLFSKCFKFPKYTNIDIT